MSADGSAHAARYGYRYDDVPYGAELDGVLAARRKARPTPIKRKIKVGVPERDPSLDPPLPAGADPCSYQAACTACHALFHFLPVPCPGRCPTCGAAGNTVQPVGAVFVKAPPAGTKGGTAEACLTAGEAAGVGRHRWAAVNDWWRQSQLKGGHQAPAPAPAPAAPAKAPGASGQSFFDQYFEGGQGVDQPPEVTTDVEELMGWLEDHRMKVPAVLPLPAALPKLVTAQVLVWNDSEQCQLSQHEDFGVQDAPAPASPAPTRPIVAD